MQNSPVWLQQSCLSRIFFLPLFFVSLGRSWQGVGSQSHLIVSWKRSSDWNIWKKHPLLLGQHFENDSLSSGLNLFCEKSCWKSCNGWIDDDPGMNDVCWDTSCPCMSDQVTETVCTCTHPTPVPIPGAKHEKSRWPNQQIVCANQQVYIWNLSYMLELPPKVCISAGNGCILHALKYYEVVFALLHLYIMRGAQTWGGMHFGRG